MSRIPRDLRKKKRKKWFEKDVIFNQKSNARPAKFESFRQVTCLDDIHTHLQEKPNKQKILMYTGRKEKKKKNIQMSKETQEQMGVANGWSPLNESACGEKKMLGVCCRIVIIQGVSDRFHKNAARVLLFLTAEKCFSIQKGEQSSNDCW
ncbi:hypothetical protein AUEXF2481DRAFT_656667 [Aureobasidium subglaciale EXF-2481]|uniref:Uncharacterized protein n=1 Tax=Aureobasidium subglaciale (strain EXF-2481) TaxID=1043005 RepID=A0A074ZB94_AURSE|nr:uncharacterized protein AUEXF2481DRAFT_656667 [Aureobasidium subglaciale EXF-2481]KEQ96006.1 hypothetical protein AUEXF2481DRAFT_656667 [Aureobasidium subglaciale EXF-2481]